MITRWQNWQNVYDFWLEQVRSEYDMAVVKV